MLSLYSDPMPWHWFSMRKTKRNWMFYTRLCLISVTPQTRLFILPGSATLKLGKERTVATVWRQCYCVSCLLRSTKGPEDGLNGFVFPLPILLAKRLVLAPLYLGSLYYRLDECVNNVVRSVWRYDVVTHAYKINKHRWIVQRGKSTSKITQL